MRARTRSHARARRRWRCCANGAPRRGARRRSFGGRWASLGGARRSESSRVRRDNAVALGRSPRRRGARRGGCSKPAPTSPPRTTTARRRCRKRRSRRTSRCLRRCSMRAPTSIRPNADGQTALMVVARGGNTARRQAAPRARRRRQCARAAQGPDGADVGGCAKPSRHGRPAPRAAARRSMRAPRSTSGSAW